MRLDTEHIKEKKVVGKISDGRPVVMIETHGGLFAMFARGKHSDVETLATAPHKAICAFLAEEKVKKDGDEIKWNDKLDETVKSEEQDRFEILRKKLFDPELGLAKAECHSYLFYDQVEGSFELIGESELQKAIDAGEIYRFGFLRKADFSEPYMLVREYGQRK